MAFIDFITLFKCYPEPIQRPDFVCVCIMCAAVGIRGCERHSLVWRENIRIAASRPAQHTVAYRIQLPTAAHTR